MASAGTSAPANGPSIAHRSVASIKNAGITSPGGPGSGSGSGPGPGGGGLPATPHTPNRPIASAFGSPSTLRAEEDVVVLEFGARRLRVGFAGDALPKGLVEFGPDQARRAGDFRSLDRDYGAGWAARASGKRWGQDYELWQFDVRRLDLGLVSDKIERALRDAFARYLLIDSKARKIVAVLPSGMPVPLLSTVLDTLFNRFQAPTVSLLSSPIMTAIGAGVRAALVVDMGWNETVVTSVCEYKEISNHRTIRAGKLLLREVRSLLGRLIAESKGKPYDEKADEDQIGAVSFEECEEVAFRMLWCRTQSASRAQEPSESLPTVHEQDEDELRSPAITPEKLTIPITSTSPPLTLHVQAEAMAEPCDNAFFGSRYSQSSFDDEETTVHQLIYHALLQLPLDVRALCMSRIIFTGGCSKILGLRQGTLDRVSSLVEQWGWDPVRGNGVEKYKTNPKLKRHGSKQASHGPIGVAATTPDDAPEEDGVWHDAANAAPAPDPIEGQLRRGRDEQPQVKGELRVIDSVGPWAGASLVSQLKITAVATVDKDLWAKEGAAGASRVSEVDLNAQHRQSMGQRQSMGPGALMRGAGGASSNWTLGVWGAIH